MNTFFEQNNQMETDDNHRPSFTRQNSVGGFDFTADNQIQIAINRFEIKENRKWENMIHPYIIMNFDGETITFIGIYLDREKKNLINPHTNKLLDQLNPNIPSISGELFIELLKQRVPIFDNFNGQIREKKMISLCNVMGLPTPGKLGKDPDLTYELTLDNSLKMMAIFLRFNCNIPVVIMGETGCGKTRLVNFFSLMHMRKLTKNLVHVKIHGGTSAQDIQRRLEEALELSKKNYHTLVSSDASISTQSPITTILFFDEANTTEEVGLIKEIMCDQTLHGKPIELKYGLKIIAAVNPYRQHSHEMIKKLESAGLGFFIASSESKEKLGHIPMRQLVYRVQPLPSSFLPLVWDFGQLDKGVENVYIKQMVLKAIKEKKFKCEQGEISLDKEKEIDLLCKLLANSQLFMRYKCYPNN